VNHIPATPTHLRQRFCRAGGVGGDPAALAGIHSSTHNLRAARRAFFDLWRTAKTGLSEARKAYEESVRYL